MAIILGASKSQELKPRTCWLMYNNNIFLKHINLITLVSRLFITRADEVMSKTASVLYGGVADEGRQGWATETV